ncbi:hypothetical protein G7Z12_37735 [Streptomyces sp. ID38640]|uniref:hypothetical protein n=1 Tax=Streptomyces sp. ID38640 TaxID=1265399 RepID=UPI00140F31C4|nr:hypothetical protein [Streptomyces sp. ID38640]QIK04706.1 hypothetical protein G7Z12_00005 [Streptomyces sp. ID38640]QIK10871.1 hypothetical protein G7Z12_37300 [Streptomyces sp. ID38640]QIK10940.1 hypothetical protein G7Z12_37735 [Streptomyces sp. ID38640]
MHLIGDIAAIRYPLPAPGSVTPADLYFDACEQAERLRAEEAERLEAASEGLDADPLLLALEDAKARKAAADAEIRRLLAYGREFHGTRPYHLDTLSQASGMTISGIRTAYGTGEIEAVEHAVRREADRRTAKSPTKAAHDG